MFVRRKSNRGGSTSIEIVEKRGRRNVIVRRVGCARDEGELKRLEARALSEIEALKPQLRLDFGIGQKRRELQDILDAGSLRAVGPELILGKIFDSIYSFCPGIRIFAAKFSW